MPHLLSSALWLSAGLFATRLLAADTKDSGPWRLAKAAELSDWLDVIKDATNATFRDDTAYRYRSLELSF
jgi:hypothetical protein